MEMKIIGNKVFFYTNYFSNFHRGDFTDPHTGLVFNTTEQAFMWYKARFFNDENSMDKISTVGAQHPRIAKSMGREVQGYDDIHWECVRFGYMVYANLLKYSQNQELKDKLLATGDKVLAEASPIDLIWGIGLAEDEDDWVLADQKNWTGRNLLGEALMKVRDLVTK
jgi:ribA/ribD-fused uncharacterized protein